MRKILIADDEVAVQRVLQRHLEPMGYRVFTASDGQEAISKAREHRVDVMLTDISMPKCGGLEVLSAARTFPSKPEVIMMTGHPTVNNAVESLREGASGFLCKPFTLEEIDRLIRQALSKRNKERPAEANAPDTDPIESLKSEFLGTVSHELRTPITGILGFASLFLEGVLGEISAKQREGMRHVATNALRLSSLAENMIDLAQLNSGTMPAARLEFALAPLVGEVAASVEMAARLKGLKLHWAAPAEASIRSDRARLKRALSNLADNAVKFTRAGEVSITTARAPDGSALEISVRDTGIGIEPDDIPLLFQDFRQLDGSTTRKFQGAGLGLAVSAKLVSLLGGTIRVESRPGRGSAFVVSLPLRTDDGVRRGQDQ